MQLLGFGLDVDMLSVRSISDNFSLLGIFDMLMEVPRFSCLLNRYLDNLLCGITKLIAGSVYFCLVPRRVVYSRV